MKTIAQGRGLPADVSEEVKRRHPEDYWGHTWAFWGEIAAIDWDEEFIAPSPSIYRYKGNVSGDMLLDWRGYLHEMKDPPALDFTQEGRPTSVIPATVLFMILHSGVLKHSIPDGRSFLAQCGRLPISLGMATKEFVSLFGLVKHYFYK